MSDTPQGPGWWMADDGRWYGPERRAGDSTVPPSDTVVVAPTGGRRRVGVIAVIAAITAVGLLLGVGAALVLLTGGDDEFGIPDEGEVFLEPADDIGDDPFTDVAFVRTPEVRINVEVPDGGDDAVGSARGSTPGLYGGTRDGTWCDPDTIAGFLDDHPDHADAFIDALASDPTWRSGDAATVGPDELGGYLDSLTPVLLTADTRVTNHGYRDGQPLPFQAVLQAGTAVLVDTNGVPRARCAGGNPLTAPAAVRGTVAYTGSRWAGFDTTRLIVVETSPQPIEVFVLVDITTGDRFERPAGTAGDTESELDATEGDASLAACTFGEVFTTDGRIPELGLTVVEDDGVFILYNASITLRDEVYRANPGAFDAIADLLLDPLDDEAVQRLNNRVGSRGHDPASVAAEFLEGQGLTGDDGELRRYDLSGVDITVGSKDFTEQLVLGELIAQAFQAAGANVTNQVNLGGTQVNRAALLSGDIDVYPEYNGTGWTVHLGRMDPAFDPDQLTANVAAADLEENGIRWLGRSPFNNTYGFAVNQDFVDANGAPTLQDMADFLAANPDATVCMESEFPNRPDGLALFEQATGFRVPTFQTRILDVNLIYTETAG